MGGTGWIKYCTVPIGSAVFWHCLDGASIWRFAYLMCCAANARCVFLLTLYSACSLDVDDRKIESCVASQHTSGSSIVRLLSTQ